MGDLFGLQIYRNRKSLTFHYPHWWALRASMEQFGFQNSVALIWLITQSSKFTASFMRNLKILPVFVKPLVE